MKRLMKDKIQTVKVQHLSVNSFMVGGRRLSTANFCVCVINH